MASCSPSTTAGRPSDPATRFEESPNISVTHTIYGSRHDDQSIPIPRDTAAARRAHRGGDRLRTGHRARGRDPPCPGGCRRRSRGSEGAGRGGGSVAGHRRDRLRVHRRHIRSRIGQGARGTDHRNARRAGHPGEQRGDLPVPEAGRDHDRGLAARVRHQPRVGSAYVASIPAGHEAARLGSHRQRHLELDRTAGPRRGALHEFQDGRDRLDPRPGHRTRSYGITANAIAPSLARTPDSSRPRTSCRRPRTSRR